MVVRDEASIILDSVGHILKNLDVDCLRVIDNGSSDATPHLLDRLQQADQRLIWRSERGGFEQHSMMTALAHEAWSAGAEWILPSDADEFFDPGGGGLAPLLEAKGVAAFEVRMRNFVQCRWAELTSSPPLETMIFSMNPSGTAAEARRLVELRCVPFLQMTYPPKHVFRASGSLCLHRGCHGADGLEGSTESLPGAEYLHAPLRTSDDLRRRILHGHRLSEVEPDPNIGWHLRRLMTMSEDALAAEWQMNSTNIGGPFRRGRRKALRLDLRLRRITRGLKQFRSHIGGTAS